MNNSVNIAVVPLDMVQGDKRLNMEHAAAMIRSLRRGVDVVVLPELFSTGFIADEAVAMRLAESNSGDTMAAVAAMASENNLAVCGSFLARTADKCYNRGFFMEPSGEVAFYDKRHLFSLSSESRMLSGGRAMPPLVRFRGWTFSLIVCYDLRFPVWCRNVGMQYDVMLVPANWPDSRRYAWEHLLIGRAIENQAYYVGANRSGQDDYGCYDGMSLAVDHMGRPVGDVDCSTGVIYVSTERNRIDEARRRMPVGNDADSMTVNV